MAPAVMPLTTLKAAHFFEVSKSSHRANDTGLLEYGATRTPIYNNELHYLE